MALAYSALKLQCADAGFLGRVELALVQVIQAANGPLRHEPAEARDTSMAAQLDRLARTILANRSAYAVLYSEIIGNQLIGKSTLLDETVTTDADLFAAATAVFGCVLPSVP